MSSAVPRSLDSLTGRFELVIAVCDQAHESLGADLGRLHWSIPDPVPVGTRAAFDATVEELRDRIAALADAKDATS